MLEALQREARPEGHAGRARHLQRHHQGRGADGHAQPAPDRPGAGRRLSGPPRPRLSRRLHPVAGALAQAARSALRRPRAVGGAAPRLRPRARDRDLQAAGILVARSRRSPPRTAACSTPASSAPTARRSRASTSATGEDAEAFKRDLELATFSVANIEAKPAKRHPYPPFTTSTLQQEASRKLGLAPAQTMRIAQRLYEGVDIGGETVGLITYMRTDGVDMAPEAVQAARRVIGKEYGDRYVPGAPRKYTTKAKNAQEAHEAIRPTDMSRLPEVRREVPRARAGPPLRADLDPHHREPDGIGRARAHHRRHRGPGRPAQARPARHRPGRQVRRLPHALQREQGRRGGRGRGPPAAR